MPPKFPTRKEINSAQLAGLRELIGVILPANRFYKKKLAALGRTPGFSSLEDFSQSVAFTTKEEIVRDQLACPPYGTNLTFPIEAYTRFHQTSGTTGTPMRWLDTPKSWQWMVESWKHVFLAAKVGPADRVYFAFSFGPFLGFWLAYDAAAQLGAMCLPGGGLSSEARLRAIIDNGVTALCCTPTYAMRLAEVAAELKIDLAQSKVKVLLVAGEPGGSIPATRARLEKLWPNASVSDHHGMTEVGPVTYECPKRPGVLHVVESAYIAEIVHPGSNEKVTPGQTGELILTTLGRTGSPLLRYRTGDLVRESNGKTPCRCGRSEIALAGGILGRADDMVIVRGVNIYPGAIEGVLREISGIAEYRVHVQEGAALVELQVEIEAKKGRKVPVRVVEKALQTAFNLRIPVREVPAGALPCFEMKARRWIRGA